MIPEDLERQISLAEAEVSVSGALALGAGSLFLFRLSLLKAFLIFFLDLCAHLSCGLKCSIGSLSGEDTLWSSQGLFQDLQAGSDSKRQEHD